MVRELKKVPEEADAMGPKEDPRRGWLRGLAGRGLKLHPCI